METTFKENFKVFVRVRPFLERELTENCSFPITDVLPTNKDLHIYEFVISELKSKAEVKEMLQNPKFYQIHQFQFDRIFDESSTQNELFEHCAMPQIDYFIAGYNCTLFAYGQTGTGKTFTIEGIQNDLGLMFKTVEKVFEKIKSLKKDRAKLSISYLQIYNEIVFDLFDDIPLNSTVDFNNYSKKLQIKNSKEKGTFVENLKEITVESPNQTFALIQQGINNRASASNNLNSVSSRSHAVFCLTLEQKIDNSVTIFSKLHIVDLAGSERITLTGVSQERLTETKKINTSLSELSNVILSLNKKKDKEDFVQYRNSKLTRLLEDSLGGNTFTSFIATISPAHLMLAETLSTLKFAARAKNIKTNVSQNKKSNLDGHLKILNKYKNGLKKFGGNQFEGDSPNFNNFSEILPSEIFDGKKLGNKFLNGKNNGDFFNDSEIKVEKEKIVEVYQEMMITQRDILIQMTNKLNNKNLELLTLKKKFGEGNKIQSKYGESEIREIKDGIDLVVESLCHAHKNMDLQSIVTLLLKIQTKCNGLVNEK